MKSLTDLLGIVLIIGGLVVLGYQGFSYTKHEEVLKIGDLQVTADTQKHVYFPPIVGAASMAAGILLIALGRIRK